MRCVHSLNTSGPWSNTGKIHCDSKRWTQFRTSIFSELYMVREWST